jgi:hypothetical protein
MTAPFTDAAMPEIVARVAYRLIERTYHNATSRDMSGAETIVLCLAQCDCFRGALPHSAMLAALHANRNGIPLRDWRDGAIKQSRYGLGFRRCWYDAYKGTRRDPRVTNRGVTPRR